MFKKNKKFDAFALREPLNPLNPPLLVRFVDLTCVFYCG